MVICEECQPKVDLFEKVLTRYCSARSPLPFAETLVQNKNHGGFMEKCKISLELQCDKCGRELELENKLEGCGTDLILYIKPHKCPALKAEISLNLKYLDMCSFENFTEEKFNCLKENLRKR